MVEALATLALSAIVLVGLGSIIVTMVGTSERAALRSERIEARGRLHAALRRDLSRMLPVRWSEPDAGLVFTGDAASLVFAVETGEGGLAIVTLAASGPDDGRHLLRTEQDLPPNAGGPEALPGAAATEIYAGPDPIAFGYVARDAPREVSGDWTSTETLPLALLVHVGDEADREVWRVPLLIDAEPGCAGTDARCGLRPAERREAEDQEPTRREDDPQ